MNQLEIIGAVSIIVIFVLFLITIFTIIKDIAESWLRQHRNKCPNCGAYLHGYQYKFKDAKFDARYCSRCGRSLLKQDEIDSIITKDTLDPIKENKNDRNH